MSRRRASSAPGAPTPGRPATPGGPRRPRGNFDLGQQHDPWQRPRSVWGISVGIHIVGLILVLLVPAANFHKERKRPTEVVFYSKTERKPPPKPLIEQKRPQPEPPKPKPKPKPKPVEIAKVQPPRELPPSPKPVIPPPTRKQPKPRAEKPVVAQRPRPRPKVQTNVFAPDEPVAKKQDAPARTTMTGAFAKNDKSKAKRERTKREIETVGFAAVKSNATREKATRVVSAVSFQDENARPGTAAPPRQARVVSPGFEETAAPAPKEPTRPYREVSATAFTETDRQEVRTDRDDRQVTDITLNGDVQQADRGPRDATVQQGGFGDGERAAPKRRKRRQDPALESPVEITSKASPVYTDEARRLKIEGEVVLKVTFGANGALKIHGVVGRLGHGLDEAAIAAAEKMQFKPARREGRPIDYTATLRVVFQLA